MKGLEEANGVSTESNELARKAGVVRISASNLHPLIAYGVDLGFYTGSRTQQAH